MSKTNADSSQPRQVRLFKNGRNQAVRIPREFELDADEALMRQEGERLVLEPLKRTGLLAVLATLQPIEEEFPDVDATLEPVDDVSL